MMFSINIGLLAISSLSKCKGAVIIRSSVDYKVDFRLQKNVEPSELQNSNIHPGEANENSLR